jgi:DNA-binding NarL/FixJ family response regulator
MPPGRDKRSVVSMTRDQRAGADHRAIIWLVEDSALFRETLGNLIDQSTRFRCGRLFPDGESAIAALSDGRELPRMILMDIALPGMSGIECTRLIRKRTPSIPVVMLTVHHSNDRIFDAICAGASGYLLKSDTSARILHGLEVALDGGAAIDGQIARRVLEMFSRMATPQADYGLSDRERQILQRLVDGQTKGQIAELLHLSPHTIDGHVRNIYAKLHVNNRSGAVAKAVKEHLLG